MFTAGLDDELARAVQRRVLEEAEEQTVGQLRAALQRAVISVDPAAAERRRKEAERNARVELFGDPEGTGSLAGRNLPAAQAAATWSRICALAKALQSSGAGGGLDLLRAQVFVGLLLGILPIIPPPPDRPADAEPEDPYEGPDGPGGSGSGGWGGSGRSDPEDPARPDADDPVPDADDPGCDDPEGSGFADSRGPDGPGPGSAGHVDVGWRAGASQSDEPGFPLRRYGRPVAAVPSWPQIPPPDAIPMPGCAPCWPPGIPPPGRLAARVPTLHR